LVFTYVFNVDQDLNLNLYFLVLGSINIVALIAGTLILFLNRDKYKRQVKATYSSEFYYLLITSIFGILGIIVLYNYLNGPIKYIGNLFVILIVIFAYLLLHLGRKYFNFNYRRKK
jgi:nitrate reductase gamma subunit